MKQGHALCIKCGKEPEKREIPKETPKTEKTGLEGALEKKLEKLSEELEKESDHVKQQEILKSINSIIETLNKVKNKQ